jgi:hypothetical protein
MIDKKRRRENIPCAAFLFRAPHVEKLVPVILMKSTRFLLLAAVALFPNFAFAQGKAKFEPDAGKVLHGAALPDYWSETDLKKQFDTFKKYSNKRAAVVTWFASAYETGRMTSWRQNYAMNLERVRKMNAVSLIKFSVQDYAYSSTKKIAGPKEIALGVYDAYFQEFAATIKDFRDPVFISINHEMNGNWYPYSQEYSGSTATASDFVASWRRIVGIFRSAGVNNVAWVWSPNVPDVGAIPAAKYYPGDEHVDWVGVSFYSGNAAEGLDSVYKTYAARKPIFITEWATAPEKSRYNPAYPGDARWVSQVFAALDKKYPRVKAISWFQYNKDDGNYLLQRVSEQQQEYSADIQSPRYIDDAGNLVTKNSGTETVVTQVVGNEVVLNEPIKTEIPPVAPGKKSTPLRERIRLENVPTEKVKKE